METVSVSIQAQGESWGGGECVSVVLPPDAVGGKGNEEGIPPVHSLLLCPSQWSAFLESTPVSLVKRREEGERASTHSLDERYYHQACDLSTEQLEQDVLEVKVDVFNEPAPSWTSPSRPLPPSHTHHSPTSSRSSSRVSLTPLLDDVLPLHTSSPLSASRPMEDGEEEESTLVIPLSPSLRLDQHREPLELRIDMEGQSGGTTGSRTSPSMSSRRGEGVVTFSPTTRLPYQTHSRNVSETSALMSSQTRPAYQTHSRNVSETPSLPPFHSSSTSSAYHSRNSSLGSQLSSSCFESDSMLSNFTDMDSCHGDIKSPIRLQDSKHLLSGRGEPTCYSSDLSLHCHMTKPIGAATQLGISPTLEDTLRGGGRALMLESVQDKRNSLTMKSSEWIKREMESSPVSLVQVKVSSKSKHVVHFNVKAGDVIIWEFATKKKDIAFGVLFEATEVATEQMPLPSSHESLENKMSSILPTFRVCTHARPTVGSHISHQDGVYEITWDNTYSRFFAKELYYRITALPAVPNDNYLQQ